MENKILIHILTLNTKKHMKLNLALFGGTGGLGRELYSYLKADYNVYSLGSADVDVTNFNEVQTFFNLNDIDVVVNLSGYNYDCFLHKYNEANHAELIKQININVIGTANIVAACLPKMREQQFGRIILASSVLADHPVISTSIYAGCKGFVDSLTKTVALENASKNIVCNSLQLGYFDGGLTYKIPETVRDTIKQTIPTKRWGSVLELSHTIKYLITVPYITGQNLNISGGII